MRRAERWIAVVGVVVAALAARDADACGWHFPNSVIGSGGSVLVSLERRSFLAELERIGPSQLPEASFAQARCRRGEDEDLADIEEALRSRGDSPSEIARLVEETRAFRDRLGAMPRVTAEVRRPRPGRAGSPIDVPAPPAGLPPAFDRYLRGAAAWRAGDAASACAAWRSVLDLPDSERRPRELRAEFMLGRAALLSSPSEARRAFGRVRELARDGVPDAVGLAAASVGWEAYAELRRGELVRALLLYDAVGDAESMLVVLRAAFASSGGVDSLAADARGRRVGTAYVVSGGGGSYGCERPELERIRQWLEATEAGDVPTVEDADRLAWIAYDAGEFESARRWIARSAPGSPLASRISTKLLLRDGRIADASARLTAAVRALPPDDGDRPRLCAELGTLELGRGEFTSALDALLGAGNWLDAAYVAERVLTLHELLDYVRRSVPPAPGRTVLYPSEYDSGDEPSGAALRALLGRRLARAGRWDEAAEFLPAEQKPRAWAFASQLRAGRDESADRPTRAAALREAARILRHDGMELVGTELAPDWQAYAGDYAWGGPESERAALVNERVGGCTPEELRRVAASAVAPDERFHYRYLAADLAWEAASLLPDGDDGTAAWLCEAGRWLADRDAKAADRFYRALVRRCGATSLGRDAAARRWFPETDR